MSEDKKDKDNPQPNEEEKVPYSNQKKSNQHKEPQYPSLGVQIRKDGHNFATSGDSKKNVRPQKKKERKV